MGVTAGLFSPQPHQHLVFSVLFTTVILVDAKWYLSVAFICIALMTNNVKHLFHVFIGHFYYILWKKGLFEFFAQV